jgi:hypothetical protein
MAKLTGNMSHSKRARVSYQMKGKENQNVNVYNGAQGRCIFNDLASGGTRNFPRRSLGFLARVSHRFLLSAANLISPKERAVRFLKPNSISLIPKAAKSDGRAFSFFRPTAAAKGLPCWVCFHQVAFGKARVRG